jgi:hypothetical protein
MRRANDRHTKADPTEGRIHFQIPLRICKRGFDKGAPIVDFCSHTLVLYQIAATDIWLCRQPETI